MKTNLAKVNGSSAITIFSHIWCLGLMVLLFSPPVFAQFEQKVVSKFSAVQVVFLAVSAVTATIAGLYVGNKMMFGQAKWPEVSHVAMGGILISIAAAFGAFIVA